MDSAHDEQERVALKKALLAAAEQHYGPESSGGGNVDQGTGVTGGSGRTCDSVLEDEQRRLSLRRQRELEWQVDADWQPLVSFQAPNGCTRKITVPMGCT